MQPGARTPTNFGFDVELLYGRNTTCFEDEEVAVRDSINDAMTIMNVTNSGGLPQSISGDICINNETSINNNLFNRSLVVVNSYTWNGRATCRICLPDSTLCRLDQQSVAEDAACLASQELTNLITFTYVDNPQSCFYQDFATVVIVTVSEVTQTPKDPCK
ncbi:hypothetical protein MHU86_5441 [Fragilaria crotonensis]|nr:hypothetical protein MHU86_5441 [Fragilaria crotonensis]